MGQPEILTLLQEGPQTAHSLSDRLGTSRICIYHQLQQLRKFGLVSLRESPVPGRPGYKESLYALTSNMLGGNTNGQLE